MVGSDYRWMAGDSDSMLVIQLFGSMPMRSSDGAANALLAAQITFSRLDGDVPEKKLYLLQFSTRGMAQPGARSAKIVRRKPLDTCFVGVLADDVPDGLFRQSIAPGYPVLVYTPEHFAGREFGGLKPLIEQRLNPAGHRYRLRMTCFALQIDDGPVVFPLLYVPEVQVHRLVPPKSARKQDGQERPITFAFQHLRIGCVPEPFRLFWRQPIPEPDTDLLDALHAPNAGRQVWA